MLDGSVIVQMSSPSVCSTFEDYRSKIFLLTLLSYLKHASRVDVVFDVYLSDSLKSACREKRGTGTRTRMLASTKIPSNWHEFLRVTENKVELFHFLADVCVTSATGTNHQILITRDENVMCMYDTDTTSIAPCSHEEADTRIFLHCLHSRQCGSKNIAARTVDTDVVVLAIHCFALLNINDLWIHFGTGKHAHLIAAHTLSAALGANRSATMPMFHAVTGCDTVSCFFGKGKKSAWDAWKLYEDVTDAFISLSSPTTVIDPSLFAVLSRFIVIMYDPTSECSDLDVARKHMFTKRSKVLESLPPTSSAFMQHVKRAVHQTAHCWSQCLVKNPKHYDASDWGWIKDGDKWSPCWTTLPEVSDSSRELIRCARKKTCAGSCKCAQANLKCTALCHCDGECSRV